MGKAPVLLIFFLAFLGAGPTTVPSSSSRFAPINLPALPNAHRVTDKVTSGGQPDGEAGFAALQKLGIKTIVSVDGAAPEVAMAHKYGMTYVHLPIGYEGVTTEQGHDIAKALADEPGPIYIHCHHGKHRSAAAVAVACVENGTLPADEAEDVLNTFGTGPNFKGLWAAAREARPLTPAELQDIKVKYVESAQLEELPGHMVSIDQHWDKVKAAQKAGWVGLSIDTPHEVLQVQEHLHEVGRLRSIAARPEDFRKWLEASDATALKLQEVLNASTIDKAKADDLFQQVTASCNSCHAAYRDGL